MSRVGCINDEGKNVDLYIPRKCSSTGRIVRANDHAAVQLNVGILDDNGVYTGEYKAYVLSGDVRKRAEGDQALNRMALADGFLDDQAHE
ncbi:40S ribosomal protein S21 [Perkinsela sp. CCAP 1560/4]|nr:40S ribosomal protein S21 [Perkinsela sp. CCAP 1560/4]|eukprot:KNH09163.1 40S ribosomal protein S21 [Perkinsela sp. CCAP 1560/4]